MSFFSKIGEKFKTILKPKPITTKNSKNNKNNTRKNNNNNRIFKNFSLMSFEEGNNPTGGKSKSDKRLGKYKCKNHTHKTLKTKKSCNKH